MINITENDQKTIVAMLDDGANNGRVSLKFPGITKVQINKIRAESNRGTEQTKRKLKRDPLLSIYRSGYIDVYELYAAEHIRYAFSLITSDITIRSMNFDGFVDMIGRAPAERESALQARMQDQYAEWFDECTLKHIKVGPIIHLLTEPITLRETDRYFGFRNGRTRGYLVEGLKLYVEMFKPRKGVSLK